VHGELPATHRRFADSADLEAGAALIENRLEIFVLRKTVGKKAQRLHDDVERNCKVIGDGTPDDAI
jgi:hypothetical protein